MTMPLSRSQCAASFLVPEPACRHHQRRVSPQGLLPNNCGDPTFSDARTSACRVRHLGRLAAVQARESPVQAAQPAEKLEIHGVQHVGFLIENLERSMDFYRGILGLDINESRPDDKLPYRGAWLMVGPDMIHLMELPNPDPKEGRPQHGGQDRHICVGVPSIEPFVQRLEAHNIPFTKSKSGRQALFFRDLDKNVLEVAEMQPWR